MYYYNYFIFICINNKYGLLDQKIHWCEGKRRSRRGKLREAVLILRRYYYGYAAPISLYQNMKTSYCSILTLITACIFSMD